MFAVFTLLAVIGEARPTYQNEVEQWRVQEVSLSSSYVYQNPFKEVVLKARFFNDDKEIVVNGFYDGDSTWKIRFMPETPGLWTFVTSSSVAEMDNISGRFEVVPASDGNHGPINVSDIYHFSYADGTPYFMLGTTSYNWLNRDEALQNQTLNTLSKSPFNKLRFGIFPKWFVFNRVEPGVFPYMQNEDGSFDFSRFNPAFFQNVEQRIEQLDEMGVLADVILFHPYDNWGFATMSEAQNIAYLKYVVSRLAAYKNVWWTMANEYDTMEPRDWGKLIEVVREMDPYGHSVGNHPIADWYDPANPNTDRLILQSNSVLSVNLARSLYKKPVVTDEYGYEGNNTMGWGDLKSNAAVLDHWKLTFAGAYASHGDTHVSPGGIQFWAAGGTMGGESPERLGFLKEIMETMPFQRMHPTPEIVTNGMALADEGEHYLFGFFDLERILEARRPTQVRLSGDKIYKVELIDPWTMRVFDLGYTTGGDHRFTLLMKPSLLKFTVTHETSATPVSLQSLLDTFSGEISDACELDETLFRKESFVYSTDYPLAQLMLNADAKKVLEHYLPLKAFEIPFRAFPLKSLTDLKIIDPVFAETIPQINAELSKISIE